MNTVDTKLRVRYAETDKMGIVYHANYYIWFEVGRADFIRSFGMTYKDMEDVGVGMPVIDTHCAYKSGAQYDDSLIIRTGIISISSTRIKFKYFVIREYDGKLLAEGETEHAFFGYREKRAVNLKKSYSELYGKLLSFSNIEEG